MTACGDANIRHRTVRFVARSLSISSILTVHSTGSKFVTLHNAHNSFRGVKLFHTTHVDGFLLHITLLYPKIFIQTMQITIHPIQGHLCTCNFRKSPNRVHHNTSNCTTSSFVYRPYVLIHRISKTLHPTERHLFPPSDARRSLPLQRHILSVSLQMCDSIAFVKTHLCCNDEGHCNFPPAPGHKLRDATRRKKAQGCQNCGSDCRVVQQASLQSSIQISSILRLMSGRTLIGQAIFVENSGNLGPRVLFEHERNWTWKNQGRCMHAGIMLDDCATFKFRLIFQMSIDTPRIFLMSFADLCWLRHSF